MRYTFYKIPLNFLCFLQRNNFHFVKFNINNNVMFDHTEALSTRLGYQLRLPGTTLLIMAN